MPDLIYEKHIEDHYAIFTMNRPERLNALGGAMGQELAEALRDFNTDDSMFAGIVTGNGRAFCAGADLKEMSERNTRAAAIRAKVESGEITADEGRTQLAPQGGGGGLGVFSESPKPIIAAVNGILSIAADMMAATHISTMHAVSKSFSTNGIINWPRYSRN